MKKQLIFLAIALVTIVTSCGKDDNESAPSKEYFTLWNQCEALSTLKAYVEEKGVKNGYVLWPVRIAVSGKQTTPAGATEIMDDPSYKDKAPADVREAAQNIRDFVRKGTALPDHFDMKHARAAAKAYAGMSIAEFDAYVKNYAKTPANGFKGMTYGESFYKPMLEVFDYLKANGFTFYVVSGSDRFICRSLTESIGIEPNRVIGMDIMLSTTKQGTVQGVEYTMGKDENLYRTDSLLIKNLKTNKVRQISQEIGKVPVLSFGNSSGDQAMHNYCLSNSKYRTATFMLVADDSDRDHADLEEGAKREKKWRENGYTVISMKKDFKTIYGFNVQKVDFAFPEN